MREWWSKWIMVVYIWGLLFISSSQCEPTQNPVFSSASIGHTSTSNLSRSKMCMQVNYEGLLLYNYKYP